MARFLAGVGLIILLLCDWSATCAQNPTVGDALSRRPSGCWCCIATPPPLRKQVAEAKVVVVGTLTNPRCNPAGDEKNAVTDLNVEAFLKTDPLVKDRKVLLLPKYIPVENPKKPPRYLVFLDIDKGKLDPYSGIPLESDALVKYLKQALALDPKKREDAIVFFVRHLDSADINVLQDTFKEVRDVPYNELRTVAKRLPADAIASRLEKDKTEWLRALDAVLLGHCGGERHAALLEKMIKKAMKQDQSVGLDGLLTGYTLLKPKEGLAVVRSVLRDEKKPFIHRYSAFRALRFFWDVRREVLPPGDIVDCVTATLGQSDFADLAIEELRLHKEVSQLERILALYDHPGFEAPVHRRAIVRYALTFKEKPAAARFIEQVRAKNPELVENCEELLKLEAEAKKQSK
jgi:hypothetical protein